MRILFTPSLFLFFLRTFFSYVPHTVVPRVAPPTARSAYNTLTYSPRGILAQIGAYLISGSNESEKAYTAILQPVISFPRILTHSQLLATDYNCACVCVLFLCFYPHLLVVYLSVLSFGISRVCLFTTTSAPTTNGVPLSMHHHLPSFAFSFTFLMIRTYQGTYTSRLTYDDSL